MPATPKRVIFITTDHMRYDCVRAYGQLPVHTPTLDRLAGAGVNFHHCYCQSPICMPSRASFMTGLYPQQTGVMKNGYSVPDNFPSLASRLFQRGDFQACQIGKLHLQPHEEHDLSAKPRNTYGFDTFIPSEDPGGYHDAWRQWLSINHPDLLPAFRLPRPNSLERTGEGVHQNPVDAPLAASCSGWITDTACRYLMGPFAKKRLAEKHFLHLGYYYPHPPFAPTREAFNYYENADIPAFNHQPDEDQDKPHPLSWMLNQRADWSDAMLTEYRRYFFACVTEVDLALKRLIDELEAVGELDDTLLVFTSDHGDMLGNHRMTHKGKSFYDDLMRVPLILHWPAGFGNKRRDVQGLVELVDLLPTLLECCNITTPGELSGQSFARPLLEGAEPTGRNDVFAQLDDGVMIRTAQHKLIRFNDHNSEVLYDLEQDPHEYVNRAGDPGYAGILQAMRLRLIDRLIRASSSPQRHTHLF